jgi:hypothetical protein
MSWIEKLKSRWQLQSSWQVAVILLVFACTGFTVMFLKQPLLRLLAGSQSDTTLASVIYYVLILPIYNVILLFYGFVFGQFSFFWAFEKRFFNRMLSIFKKHKN